MTPAPGKRRCGRWLELPRDLSYVSCAQIYGERGMAMVTSAELQKNFGHYRKQAQAERVLVTQYGKPSVVMISAAEYERLKELDRRVMLLDEMSDAEIEE